MANSKNHSRASVSDSGETSASSVRIAALADIHYGRDAATRLRPLFEQVSRRADLLLLAGDLTDLGLPEEPEKLFPFLGCSRLEEPINRYEVTVVFHGHAHHGAPEGRTSAGIPVYNVALSALKRLNPDGVPLRIIELPAREHADSVQANGQRKEEMRA